MFNLKIKLATAAIAVAAAGAFATPAIAGQCADPGRQCSRQRADHAQGRDRHGDRSTSPSAPKSASTAASCARAAWSFSRAESCRCTAIRIGPR